MARRAPMDDRDGEGFPLTPTHPSAGDTLTGTIKTLHADKGFGFIRTADGAEYFFHRSSAIDFQRLDQGMTVQFVPGAGPKGPRAEHVERA